VNRTNKKRGDMNDEFKIKLRDEDTVSMECNKCDASWWIENSTLGELNKIAYKHNEECLG
jgi:hypothetical protein